MLAAHAIEPAIEFSRFTEADCFNYLAANLLPTIAYRRLCNAVGDRQFTEVFLLPYLTIGGADRYVLVACPRF